MPKSNRPTGETAFAERTPLAALGVVLGLFFGGGALGLWLADQVASESAVAALVSFLALPAAFMLGFVLWAGAALPGAWRRFQTMRRAKVSGVPADLLPVAVPPGAFAFVPAALIVNAGAGLLVGMLASDVSSYGTWVLYLLIGAAYGITCWQLAKRGLLAFPNE
ncbi:MAG TPA: hypothetical protein VIS73_06675 [Rhodocyclaceae bacterium]